MTALPPIPDPEPDRLAPPGLPDALWRNSTFIPEPPPPLPAPKLRRDTASIYEVEMADGGIVQTVTAASYDRVGDRLVFYSLDGKEVESFSEDDVVHVKRLGPAPLQ